MPEKEPNFLSAAELATQVPRRLRAEANFLKFPFFQLTRESRKSSSGGLHLCLDLSLEQDGERDAKVYWNVIPSPNIPSPGEFARRLHREVVERAISELPRPVKNPICLGSFSHICRTLGITSSGANIRRIRSALTSIRRTAIHTKGTFYLKAKKARLDLEFSLYDQIGSASIEFSDGRLQDAVYIHLSDWYLSNLNTNYVIPLDFRYFRQLTGPVASRMYELLHHWFFVALRGKRETIQRRYSTLCTYFPLTHQDALWKAKKQLRAAHKQHVEHGYLACLPAWRRVPGTRKDWTLIYTAGPRANDEYRRNQSRRDQDGVAPDELPAAVLALSAPASPPDPREQLRRDLARELEVRGIAATAARELAAARPPDYLRRKLEIFDYLMRQEEHPITENPAGYLRASIEQDFAPPEGFISPSERQRQLEQERAEQQARFAAEARARRAEQDRTTRLRTLFASLPANEQARLRDSATARLSSFALERLHQEQAEGRHSTGHVNLEAELFKLLAAEHPDAAGD